MTISAPIKSSLFTLLIYKMFLPYCVKCFWQVKKMMFILIFSGFRKWTEQDSVIFEAHVNQNFFFLTVGHIP